MTIEEYTEILDCDGQGIKFVQDISTYKDTIRDRSYMCNNIYESSSDKFGNSVKTYNVNTRYSKDREYGSAYLGSVKLNREYDFPFTIEFITNRLADNMYYYQYQTIFSKDRFLHVRKEV